MVRFLVASACLCLTLAGCAADEGGTSRDDGMGGGSGGGGGGGAAGATNFGNSTVAPMMVTNPTITGGMCKAGHYIGQFNGMYMSPLIFEIPIPVESIDAAPLGGGPPLPGLEFWLNESEVECEVGQEFCADFVVEGGKMRGQANGVFPFEIDLEGELDCTQGVFRGELRNGYYIAFGAMFMFEGTIESEYDAANSQFFNGLWDVKEPMGVNAGGSGEWYAGWVMD